jgi:ribosomal protein L37AE/L43A
VSRKSGKLSAPTCSVCESLLTFDEDTGRWVCVKCKRASERSGLTYFEGVVVDST